MPGRIVKQSLVAFRVPVVMHNSYSCRFPFIIMVHVLNIYLVCNFPVSVGTICLPAYLCWSILTCKRCVSQPSLEIIIVVLYFRLCSLDFSNGSCVLFPVYSNKTNSRTNTLCPNGWAQ